jgi:hypothetical protein
MTTPLLQLLAIGLQYGLVLGLLLAVLFIGLAILNPEAWVNDYPPDIREKYGPMSDKARGIRKLAAIPMAVILFGTIWLAMLALQRSSGSVSFVDAFVVIFVMLFVFNLIDLLIIDWLLFVTLQPRLIILPGTEGMAGSKDYGFHLRAFLKGIVGTAVGSLILPAWRGWRFLCLPEGWKSFISLHLEMI